MRSSLCVEGLQPRYPASPTSICTRTWAPVALTPRTRNLPWRKHESCREPVPKAGTRNRGHGRLVGLAQDLKRLLFAEAGLSLALLVEVTGAVPLKLRPVRSTGAGHPGDLIARVDLPCLCSGVETVRNTTSTKRRFRGQPSSPSVFPVASMMHSCRIEHPLTRRRIHRKDVAIAGVEAREQDRDGAEEQR